LSEKDSALREFELIKDEAAAQALLKEGSRTLASATIWTKNQEHVVSTHLGVYSEAERILYAWAPKDFHLGKFMDFLVKAGTNDCYFSVSLSRANIFFKTPFAGHDQGGIKFKIPQQIYKVQRRKDLRMPIPDGYVMKVDFRDPLFPDTIMTRKVLDISAGGISIRVGKMEEAVFQPGLVLNDLALFVRSRHIVCSAEIRHVRALPPESPTPGIKVGLAFLNLKQADVQHLAQYVFEETRKFFSRFM
jgi:hypothetical protein